MILYVTRSARKQASWVGSALFALLLSACGPPPEPSAIPPAFVQAGSVPSSTSSPATSSFQIGLTQADCVDQARFIEDLTVPDGTRVAPGALIDKRWSVLNSGTCNWGPGYRLIRTDDGSLTGPSELALYPARAGEPAVWQVLLTAPREPGQHIASWQARSPSGELFGDPVFVLVEVGT